MMSLIREPQLGDVHDQATKLVDLIVQGDYRAPKEISGGTFETRYVRPEVESYPATFVSNPELSASSIHINPMTRGRFLLDIQFCSEIGLEDLTLRCEVEPRGNSLVVVPWSVLVP